MQKNEKIVPNRNYKVKITGLRWADMLALKRDRFLFQYVDLNVMPSVGHLVLFGPQACGRSFRIEQIIHTVDQKTANVPWVVLTTSK